LVAAKEVVVTSGMLSQVLWHLLVMLVGCAKPPGLVPASTRRLLASMNLYSRRPQSADVQYLPTVK